MKSAMIRTWVFEITVVWIALIGVVWVTRGGLIEAVGALAVLAAFAHAQVAERMREREALKSKPDVHCHRWSTRYFMAKELLWLSYFIAHRSWSALVGVGVFLAYPLWRKWWRARHPINSGSRGNGAQGDLATGLVVPHETPRGHYQRRGPYREKTGAP